VKTHNTKSDATDAPRKKSKITFDVCSMSLDACVLIHGGVDVRMRSHMRACGKVEMLCREARKEN
jgi:hypothetical protein